MPYIDYKTEDTWQKRLFDKLITVEDKLDRLLVLQEQSVDTTVHPPLKPEYLDIIDVSKILKVEQKTRSEEHTSELQSRQYLVCRLLLEKKTTNKRINSR